jgi:hypothetical protein
MREEVILNVGEGFEPDLSVVNTVSIARQETRCVEIEMPICQGKKNNWSGKNVYIEKHPEYDELELDCSQIATVQKNGKMTVLIKNTGVWSPVHENDHSTIYGTLNLKTVKRQVFNREMWNFKTQTLIYLGRNLAMLIGRNVLSPMT